MRIFLWTWHFPVIAECTGSTRAELDDNIQGTEFSTKRKEEKKTRYH